MSGKHATLFGKDVRQRLKAGQRRIKRHRRNKHRRERKAERIRHGAAKLSIYKHKMCLCVRKVTDDASPEEKSKVAEDNAIAIVDTMTRLNPGKPKSDVRHCFIMILKFMDPTRDDASCSEVFDRRFLAAEANDDAEPAEPQDGHSTAAAGGTLVSPVAPSEDAS